MRKNWPCADNWGGYKADTFNRIESGAEAAVGIFCPSEWLFRLQPKFEILG